MKIYTNNDYIASSNIIFSSLATLYLVESKVLQYFGNVRHSSAALDTFTEVVKVANHTRLWAATHLICLHDFGSQPQEPYFYDNYLIIKVFVTQAKFLEPSGNYCDWLHLHLSHECFWLLPWCHEFLNKTTLIIHLCSFQITEWSNAQCVNAPTTMILPAIEGTSYRLNCFGHVIYMSQTKTYKNTMLNQKFCNISKKNSQY